MIFSCANAIAIIMSANVAAPTAAAGGEAKAEGSLTLDVAGAKGSAAASGAGASGGGAEPWIRRHRPRVHDLEVGVFGGVLAPSRQISLQDPGIAPGDYARVAANLGFRIGYYPMRFFGMEGEAAFMPTRFEGDDAYLYAARAHGVLQLGLWSVTPFVLLGGGMIGVESRDNIPGNDREPALHVGGGLKIHITEHLMLRLEARDVMVRSQGTGDGPSHSAEGLFTIGARFNVGPKAPPAAPPKPDRDGDGVPDEADHCQFLAGDNPQGCPYADGDCDDFKDNVDACPDVAGVAPQGCPPPDGDGDGILDPDDQCPAEAGPAPSGCPIRDTDGDGFDDPVDRCVDEPETRNGFEDTDGCPDEVPQAVARFTGVIQGIFFDSNKATIKPVSEPVLEAAAEVLREYPDVKLEISGHTDTTGTRERNLALSLERAEAVKAYLVEKGISADRIRTRGAGPDEPIGDNATRDGRTKNRRIEFKMLQDEAPKPAEAAPEPPTADDAGPQPPGEVTPPEPPGATP